MNRRNELIDLYGLSPEEVYGDQDPDYLMCAYCEMVVTNDELSSEWWRLSLPKRRCSECRRGHLEQWLRKLKLKSK